MVPGGCGLRSGEGARGKAGGCERAICEERLAAIVGAWPPIDRKLDGRRKVSTMVGCKMQGEWTSFFADGGHRRIVFNRALVER